MERVLNDNLRDICRGLLRSVADAVPGEILACDLVQIDRREFRFQSVAAAHFTDGPVRRLLLGCEERLAEHFAVAHTLDAVNTTGDPVHDGLKWFCQQLQTNLVGSGLVWADRQSFLVHDHEQFRVNCSGVRNFLFRVAVAEGRLDLVLDLAPRLTECDWLASEIARTGTTQTNASDDAITDPDLVCRIMAHLADSGADVQLKVPGEGDRLELLQATFLADHSDIEHGRLALTCARRTSLERAEDVPEKATLVFILQDKLLQCNCFVVDNEQVWLDDDITLPILQLGLPSAVTFGQRRGAFRLEPPEKLITTVQRVTANNDAFSAVRRRVPAVVCDLSFTGAMLQLGSQAIISSFKGGTTLECIIELPDDFGSVTLQAVVRRVHVSHDDLRRGAMLGVEFVDSGDNDAMDTLRDYIQDRHTAGLSGGSAELEIG